MAGDTMGGGEYLCLLMKSGSRHRTKFSSVCIGACVTFFILAFEFGPLLEHHFEFLEAEIVCKAIPSWIPLDEVVFVGCVLLHGPVEVDSVPA